MRWWNRARARASDSAACLAIPRRRGFAAAFLSLAFAIAPAGAAPDMQHPVHLGGEMFIGGGTLVDPPPGEPKNTHAYLHLSGPSARALFDALRANEVADACTPGRRMKKAGSVTCSVRGKSGDASCDFALDLTHGAIAAGPPC